MKRNKRQLNAISRSYANKMKQKYYDFIKDNAIDEKVLGLDKIKYIENKKKALRKRGYNIWLIWMIFIHILCRKWSYHCLTMKRYTKIN